MNFNHNRVKDISPLSGLSKLNWAYFSDNNITEIPPLSGLDRLAGIFLDGNQVSDITGLSGLTGIGNLDLTDNRVTDISVLSGLKGLDEVHLGNNQITDISSLSGLLYMFFLDLSKNRIHDIGALVANPDFAFGDRANVTYNYLDLTPGSQNMADIQTLIDRGVGVTFQPQNEGAPVLAVATMPVSSLAETAVTLTGNLTSKGNSANVTVFFEWGLTPEYGNSTPAQEMNSIGQFCAIISGLTADTTYHYRAVAIGDGRVNGTDMTFTTLHVNQNVRVSINAPTRVPPGCNFTVGVDIMEVSGLDAANFNITFDPAVLRLEAVTGGNVGGIVIPVDLWVSVSGTSNGTFTIVENIPGTDGASGSGTLAMLQFRSIGENGTASSIDVSGGCLSDCQAIEIPATWVNDSVVVSTVQGDVNGDGAVNAVDITKVERIIAGLDSETPDCDGNLDGYVNAVDITKVERIIAGLP